MVITSTLKEGIEQNNLITAPFVRKYLPEDQEEEGERITIRVNKREREQIEFLKKNYNYSSDSTVIKLAVTVFENVTLHTLGVEVAGKVSSQKRRKPIK